MCRILLTWVMKRWASSAWKHSDKNRELVGCQTKKTKLRISISCAKNWEKNSNINKCFAECMETKLVTERLWHMKLGEGIGGWWKETFDEMVMLKSSRWPHLLYEASSFSVIACHKQDGRVWHTSTVHCSSAQDDNSTHHFLSSWHFPCYWYWILVTHYYSWSHKG